jgi:hypothetical protein
VENVLIGVFAIALLTSLTAEIKKRGSTSIPRTVWQYFSFYTILSNLLVFVWLIGRHWFSDSSVGQFTMDANVSAAITFYLFTVGVANYALYGWQPLSLFNRISDLLVHAVTPTLTTLYWCFFVDKSELELSYIGYWLIYPLSYALYTASHGIWTKFYPYDFTDVQALGAERVALNALFLSISLIIGGSVFIILGRAINHW